MLLAGGAGVDVRNAFEMGPLLKDIAAVCVDAGATPIIAHHFIKRREDPYAPPELVDLSYSGMDQFIRQWLLVAPRERFDAEAGRFRLHFNYGGSAGHCGEYAVDIEVGRLDPDMDRRKWEVTVATPTEFRSTRQEQEDLERRRREDEREIVRADRKVHEERQDMVAAVAVFRKQPDQCLTATRLATAAGWNYHKARRILYLLEEEGHIATAELKVRAGNNATQAVLGYRLLAGKGVIA
jgi:hypothetical protein